MQVLCAGCHETKHTDGFYPSVLQRGHAMRCKACMLASARSLAERRGTRRRFLHHGDVDMECGRCGVVKPHAEFYPSLVSSGKSGWCKDCVRTYYRALHASRPHWHAEIQRKQRARKRAYVREFKRQCVQCGESHPAVLDMHHTDPEAKSFNLSWGAANNRSLSKLDREIAKCVVLCANCHRKMHWNETQTAKGKQSAPLALEA